MKRTFASRAKLAWWGVFTLCWLLVLAGAFAEETGVGTSGANPPGTTFEVKDAPLADVIRLLTSNLGADVIMTDAVTGTIKYLDLKDRRPEEILDQICKTYNLRWRKDETGTYIITGKDEGGGGQAEAAPAAPLPEAPPLQRGKNVSMIDITFAEAQDLSYLFGGAAQPLTQRYRDWEGYHLASSLGAGATMERAVRDSVGLIGGSPAGEPGGEAGGPYRELTSYLGGMPQYQLPGTYVPGVVTPAATATQPGRPAGQAAGPEVEVPGAGGPLGYLLPKGLTGPPVAFAPLNALIVQGTEEAIEEFRKLVALLDVKVPQVEIETQFVEMRVEDSRAVGIDWSWLTSEVTVDAGISPGGGTFVIQYGKGDFAATLSALLQTSRARVISAPRVTTLNNYPASITFAETTPIFLSTSVVQPGLPGGQVVTGSELTFLPVASNLFVVPRINGDGSITTFITPTIASTAGTVTGPGGQTAPIPRSQSLQTMLRVKNGETIVMGGFINKERSKSKSKIPLLSDLPIIGSLFVGTSEQVTDREILIFLTPRIIPEETPGAPTAGVVVP